MRRLACHRGFSLIELITVIVILGIIAVIGTQFIVNATESYRSTQTRALLANTGRQAVERMTRQLRGALPYSVHTTNGGNCVQFMPIAAAGFYLQPVSITDPSSTINTSPFNVEYFTAEHLVIGALSDTEIYDGSVRANLASPISDNSTRTAVSFDPYTWERNSASQRFYLVSSPQAFCLNATELQFYENLSPSGGNVGLGNPPDELLARNAATTGAPLFTVNNATAENNIIVNINIGFSEGGETVDFFQEVSLRNVP